jgi:hypothetical protein
MVFKFRSVGVSVFLDFSGHLRHDQGILELNLPQISRHTEEQMGGWFKWQSGRLSSDNQEIRTQSSV